MRFPHLPLPRPAIWCSRPGPRRRHSGRTSACTPSASRSRRRPTPGGRSGASAKDGPGDGAGARLYALEVHRHPGGRGDVAGARAAAILVLIAIGRSGADPVRGRTLAAACRLPVPQRPAAGDGLRPGARVPRGATSHRGDDRRALRQLHPGRRRDEVGRAWLLQRGVPRAWMPHGRPGLRAARWRLRLDAGPDPAAARRRRGQPERADADGRADRRAFFAATPSD